MQQENATHTPLRREGRNMHARRNDASDNGGDFSANVDLANRDRDITTRDDDHGDDAVIDDDAAGDDGCDDNADGGDFGDDRGKYDDGGGDEYDCWQRRRPTLRTPKALPPGRRRTAEEAHAAERMRGAQGIHEGQARRQRSPTSIGDGNVGRKAVSRNTNNDSGHGGWDGGWDGCDGGRHRGHPHGHQNNSTRNKYRDEQMRGRLLQPSTSGPSLPSSCCESGSDDCTNPVVFRCVGRAVVLGGKT